MKKILLIDGTNLLFRAYYATAYSNSILRTPDGQAINGVYAFIKMLDSISINREYYSIIICFDAGKKTFRHEKLTDYKAGRSETPEDLKSQFKILQEYLNAAGIHSAEKNNFEADDLVGYFAKEAEKQGFLAEILTSDKDFLQLISPHVNVLINKKGVSQLEIFNEEKLKKYWGVSPQQVPDLKGIMGDPSDNLKGVKGIGEKGAIKLIAEYGSLENVISNIDKLSPSLARKIQDSKADALLCKEIATIDVNCISTPYTFLEYKINLSAVNDFYFKYNMKSLIINKDKKPQLTQPVVKIITDTNDDMLDKQGFNSIWLETDNDNYHKSNIIGIGISNRKGTFFVEGVQLNFSGHLKKFLSSLDYKKITYDNKRVFVLLSRWNIAINNLVEDLLIIGHLVNSQIKPTLENFVSHLNIGQLRDPKDFWSKYKKNNTSIPVEEIANFCGAKTVAILKCLAPLHQEMKNLNLFNLYYHLELPLAENLSIMELNGVRINKVLLEDIKISNDKICTKLKQDIIDIAGENVNPNSPKQIQELLFDKMKLPNFKKNSTSQEALELIIKNGLDLTGIVVLILEYRKFQKLQSTYIIGLEKYIDNDSKIHTTYNQCLTSTGRLSSSSPNMQNISVKDKHQKEVRKIFEASSSDRVLVSLDYSQIELRVLAHLSKDKKLINYFQRDLDIHTETAKKIFPNQTQISKNDRRRAKTINFGVLYGMSPFRLSAELDISIKEAQSFIYNYFSAFPSVKDYINETINFCKKNKYVKTMFERRRYIHDILNPNKHIREFSQRAAVNTTIQGSAADIIKKAYNEICTWIKESGCKIWPIAQVHDELIWEVYTEDKDRYTEVIKNKMENAVDLLVPLKVNVSTGKNWYEL